MEQRPWTRTERVDAVQSRSPGARNLTGTGDNPGLLDRVAALDTLMASPPASHTGLRLGAGKPHLRPTRERV